MAPRYDVLIVGGGHGGAQTALALRQQKFAGSIAIIGEETELPYERPPLSKEYLAGDRTWEKLRLRSADAWAEREIDMLLGRRVTAVDAVARTVTSDDGTKTGYGQLVWATGGSPRRLSCAGHDLVGVHGIRCRADVDRMITELPAVARVVVIGGGYIGLEAASVLSKLGKRVTVLEALDRVLARVAGEPLSRFYEAEHRAHGIDLRCGIAVESIEECNGRAAGVRLADGHVLACDMVIVGIGIVPAVAPLIEAGAQGGNGVRVDARCRTTLPWVFAIGDCAEHISVHSRGDWLRLESVQNATDMAGTVAKQIVGRGEDYAAVPWFWSNQYDLKLQTVGLSRGYDDCILRGDPKSRAFSLVYLKNNTVIALDCVNMVRDYAHGRALVATAANADRAMLADPSVALKSILREADDLVIARSSS